MTWPRIVAHADMDAFYASVEQLDDPDLRGKPLIVGPKSNRGIVLTASYEARPFGIKSAMPIMKARQLCPQAIVVPPRFERYQQQSKAIMEAFADFSPSIEAISLDEAFIEMTGAEGIFGTPLQMAQKIQAAVHQATGGLTASVGIASTKYVAKVASDFNKPNGVTVVNPENAIDWLDPMPVSRLWGAGPKTVPRIERLGLYTIGDVRRADPAFLEKHLGRMGLHFQSLARAEDPRRVARRRTAKSMGSDRTLEKDVSSREEIEQYLRRSADRIGRRLREKGYRCKGVRVKLKTNRFQLFTRQVLLTETTDNADTLFKVGSNLLGHFLHEGPFRLVGLAAYEISREDEPQQGDLFASSSNSAKLEKTVDNILSKFGNDVVKRAGDLGRSKTVSDVSPNLDFVEIPD